MVLSILASCSSMNTFEGSARAVCRLKNTQLSSLVHLNVPLADSDSSGAVHTVLELQRALQETQLNAGYVSLVQSCSSCTVICSKVQPAAGIQTAICLVPPEKHMSERQRHRRSHICIISVSSGLWVCCRPWWRVFFASCWSTRSRASCA